MEENPQVSISAARVEIETEVAALREALSRHQQTIADLCCELEEERAAAASATDEAMSMILRLQREKADAQMEARQFKRLAEEKMLHDQQELEDLEDKLFVRERAIQAYRRRLIRLGADLNCADLEEESEPSISPENLDYPPLKCCDGGKEQDLVSEREHLMNLGRRMDDLETEKKIAVEMEEEDRIYTVDTIHRDDPPEEDKVSIKKLYKRLEALEADRESMRRAIVSMRTDKAQLFLLKEIAQNLYQEKAISKSRSECSVFVSVIKVSSSFSLYDH